LSASSESSCSWAGRRVELTEAGRVLLQHARGAREAVDHAVQAAREASGETRRLRLGYPATVAPWYVPATVRTFRERFPAIALETVVGHTGFHLMAVNAHQLDLAFVRLGSPDGDATSFRPLHRERIVVAMADDHPLARRPVVRVEHLAGEPVVLLPRTLDPPLYDHLVNDICLRAGISLSVVLEATTLESGLVAAAASLGLAFTTESAVDLFTVTGVVFRPLATTVPALQVGLTWRRDTTSRAVRQFLAVVDEIAGATPPHGPSGSSSPW
jgi:DNA-binding transcriptional LysR family regulator